MTNHQSPSRELTLAIGDLNVSVIEPPSAEEPTDRISFWWSVTSSSIALAEYLESMGDLRGRRILELGCGLGLAGIVAAMRGAHVVFSDYVPESLEHARAGAQLNAVPDGQTEFRILDWEHPGALPRFDLIVGSEILYEYYFHGSLIGVMESALEPDGRIVLADRKRLAVSRFIGRMTSRGFDCAESSHLVDRNGFPRQEITVFRLKRAT